MTEEASKKKEDKKPAAAGDDAAASSEEKPADGGAKGNKKERPKREEKPVEEMFDLSKPIPRVEKPNKAEHDKLVQELTDDFEKMKDERKAIQDKIDNAMHDPAQKAKLQEARAKLNEFKTQKNSLINDKKEMRAKLDAARSQTDKIIKDKKDAGSKVKFNSIDEINKEIAKLHKKQETTSMSLNEEKKLIKDIDALEASKKYVEALRTKDAAMDDVRELRKQIATEINAKDKEIDAVSAKIDSVMEAIKAMNDVESKKRDSLQELFQKRDEIKKRIGEKLKEKDAIRDDFREKNNAWYDYQRAIRAQKKIAYEEEKKKREEEKAAYLAKLEEEEAKKIPYEEEQALCDYLADYLERTYLTGKSEGKDGAGDSGKKADVVAVKDDPFANFKPVNKKNDEDEYFGKGKGKKKRVRATKKQDSSAGPFTLSVDTFEQFGLLQLNPPTSVEQVAASVKELREKKEFYKKQERGAVPTAAEIRKANEKAAAKMRQQAAAAAANNGAEASGGAGAGGGGKSKGGGKAFSLDNDDFAPLGAGKTAASSAVNASWGSKAPSVAAPAAATAEEEEAVAAAAEC